MAEFTQNFSSIFLRFFFLYIYMQTILSFFLAKDKQFYFRS